MQENGHDFQFFDFEIYGKRFAWQIFEGSSITPILQPRGCSVAIIFRGLTPKQNLLKEIDNSARYFMPLAYQPGDGLLLIKS